MKNLIGISGKKGSGKDTVGKIVQYLVDCKAQGYTHPYTQKDFESYLINGHDKDSKFDIKKFAGKLKQMVALLIGCSVEDLEDEEFKNKPLGEEWNCILGETDMGGHRCIYEVGSDMHKSLESDYGKFEPRVMTPRLMLQLLGTEGMRDILHPNVHVNALFADYHGKPLMKIVPYGVEFVGYADKKPNWIITDVRFPNELEAIKKRGGLTIRVDRSRYSNGDFHVSETALDNAEFDYTINNNGTIEQLIEKVREILIKEKIIL